MIIDPPSDFAPLKDWQRFRKEMEVALIDKPDDSDLLEHLDIAKATEERLKVQ